MKRLFAMLLIIIVSFNWMPSVVSALIRNESGKAPAPSKLIDAKRTFTQEKDDGFIYIEYSGATDADWDYLHKLLLYTGYIPTGQSGDSNYSYYAYNIEFGATALVLYLPEQNDIIVCFPKNPGLMDDAALASIVGKYEGIHYDILEIGDGYIAYSSLEAVTGTRLAEQGVSSDEHIFEGKSCRFEYYSFVPFPEVSDYLAHFVALGFDIKILFRSDSPTDYYFFCTHGDAELIVKSTALIATVYFEPGVDWYELDEETLNGIFDK